MAPLEILLLNYFSVLLFTVAFGIFIAGLDKKLRSFSIWYWIAQALLSLVLYKLIQLYDGFPVIYVADILLVSFYLLCKVPNTKSNKHNKVNDLAKALPRLHKLSTEEFSVYLTKLFKAYGFQSVKQVKIQNDDTDNTYDYYLLARHESSLVEIRIINLTKKLTEKHINEVASNFRDSTSQATSWLLATSAKADVSTNIHIRNSGADIKVFDSKAISDLIYVLAPEHKPNRGIVKSSFIKILDYLVQKLSSAKNKLTLEQTSPSSKAELVASQQLMSDVLNENETLAIPDGPDDEISDSSTDDQPSKMVSVEPESVQVEEIKTIKTDEKPNESNIANLEEKHDTNSRDTIQDIEEAENNSMPEKEADTHITEVQIAEPSIPDEVDENIQVEAEADPLDDINNIAVSDTQSSVEEEDFDDFKVADTTSLEQLSYNESAEIDLLLVSTEPDSSKESINASDDHSEEILEVHLSENIDITDVKVEEEADQLANIEVMVDSAPVVTEPSELDDFAMADIDLMASANSESISVDLLMGEPMSETNASEQAVDPTDSSDILAEDIMNEVKLPDFKIELSDLGAALPEHKK